MNRIVFVLYNLCISSVVDLIHLFLYFSFVISSWCLRDFPVSGQITAFAISGERVMGDVGFDERQHVEFADKLLPLPQPPVRARTDARTNPSAQRATQLRRVLARVYAVSAQNQITTSVP
jgi:hypothetical protein